MSYYEGILINLYKDIQENYNDTNSETRDKLPNIVWSYYDRISIEKVTNMREYFLGSENQTEFVGNIQSFHLYKPTDNPSNNVFNFEKTETETHDSLIKLAETGYAPQFFSITAIRLSDIIKDYAEYSSTIGMTKVYEILNSEICNIINDNLPCEIKNIWYEIYRSLGSEDFVIICTSDSIKELAIFVEILRKITFEYYDILKKPEMICKKRLIETTYTFAGMNNPNSSVDIDSDDKIKANIHLTLKNISESEDFIKELNDSIEKQDIHKDTDFLSLNSMGKFDINIIMGISNSFLSFYSDNGLLKAENTKYKDCVYQSHTVLLYKDDITTIEELEINENIYNILKLKDKKTFTQIEELWGNMSQIKRTDILDKIKTFSTQISIPSHLEKELNIFFTEYEYNVCSSFNRQWHKDLMLQMNAVSSVLSSFLDSMADSEYSKKYVMDTIIQCITVLKETYEHIGDTSRCLLDKSKPISYYSGSYNNILKAYYGIIRTILSIGYCIPHNKETIQKNIAFSINFVLASQVSSKMYMLSENENSTTEAFVTFFMPYESLYNIPKYTLYLIHEVFHYITPVDRMERNELLLKISLDITLNQFIKSIFQYEMITHNPSYCAAERKDDIKKTINIFVEKTFSPKIQKIIEESFEKNEFSDILKKRSALFYKEFENILTNLQKGNILRIMKAFLNTVSEHTIDEDDTIESKRIKDCLKKVFRRLSNEFKNDKPQYCYEEQICNIISGYDMMQIAKMLCCGLYEGLSESICDLYIINILDIPFSEYMEHLVLLIDEIPLKQKRIKELSDKKDLILRIGILTDLFCEPDKKPYEWLNSQLETFCYGELIDYKDIISSYYNEYLVMYSAYKDMLLEYLKHLSPLEISKNISNTFNDYWDLHKKWQTNISILRTFYKKKADNDFDKNISMIELFQYQRPVHITCSKVNEYYKKCEHTDYIPKINFKNAADNKYNLSYTFHESVGNIGDYLKAVDKLICSFQNSADNPPIWFRGVCNAGYDLRPGIFRSLKDDRSPYAFMTDNLKKLHEKTAAYPDLWKRMPGIIDQITCLQHYGGATNFMDFSTDALTSLHFAINPDNENDKNKSVDAVVYIVNPRLFNEGMNKLFHKDRSGSTYHAYCATLLNDKDYKHYIPTDFSDHYIEKQNLKYKKLRKASETLAYSKMKPPRTLIVPQNNDRIRAQYGSFIVYPLDIWPDTKSSATNANDLFEYTCLCKLQKKVVENGGAKFLEKIIIRSNSIANIRQQLLHLGITTARMYPELDKIIKEL